MNVNYKRSTESGLALDVSKFVRIQYIIYDVLRSTEKNKDLITKAKSCNSSTSIKVWMFLHSRFKRIRDT
jgi:hypothetical protein